MRRAPRRRWPALVPAAVSLCALAIPAGSPAGADDHQPRPGGTVTVVVPSDDGTVRSLDPTASWATLSTPILQGLVTRSLTTYVTDPRTGRRTLVPDLATDLGRHNKDYTEWRFTLRRGVRYENGRRVTARDVRYGILRSFDGNNGTLGGGVAGPGTEYSARHLLGGRTYNGPYASGTHYRGVTVRGDTLTIRMDRPFPEMSQWASFPAIGPIPPGRPSAPRRYRLHPLATGPYRVESFEPGRQLVLERNPAWSRASDPTRGAWPDRWVFRFGQDPATADALLLSDAYDARKVIVTSLLPQSVSEARHALGDRVLELPTPCGRYLAMDRRVLPDLRVRRAIAYAYPRTRAWEAAGEVPGVTRQAGDALLPPGVPGRVDVGLDHGRHIQHDLARARRLLAEAGRRPGQVRLRWVVDVTDPLARAASTVVARAFREAGFDARPIPFRGSPADVVDAAAAGRPRARAILRRTDLEPVTFCADWPSGTTVLPELLRTGSPFNPAGFHERSVDRQLDRIAGLSPGRAAPAWGRLDEQVQRRWFPMFPTGYLTEFLAYGRDLTGVARDERGTPDFRDVHVLR